MEEIDEHHVPVTVFVKRPEVFDGSLKTDIQKTFSAATNYFLRRGNGQEAAGQAQREAGSDEEKAEEGVLCRVPWLQAHRRKLL